MTTCPNCQTETARPCRNSEDCAGCPNFNDVPPPNPDQELRDSIKRAVEIMETALRVAAEAKKMHGKTHELHGSADLEYMLNFARRAIRGGNDFVAGMKPK